MILWIYIFLWIVDLFILFNIYVRKQFSNISLALQLSLQIMLPGLIILQLTLWIVSLFLVSANSMKHLVFLSLTTPEKIQLIFYVFFFFIFMLGNAVFINFNCSSYSLIGFNIKSDGNFLIFFQPLTYSEKLSNIHMLYSLSKWFNNNW